MAIAGYGKTQIRYDMFDMERDAEQARRFARCENIYHKGQDLAWDGKDILPMLLKEHGGINIPDDKRKAISRIFAIIMWGELAAWKISAQLADGLVPLEAKMAATSQAFDEARHFYVMHDYLKELGYVPKRMDRPPQALLDLVLDTPNLAYKLLGMQLMIETMALTIFQTVRELKAEPVIAELMKYYERDEARHVGLGMQYLPEMIRGMSKAEVSAMMVFQARILFWAMWETKMLEKDFETLGIEPRKVMELGRSKQVMAMKAAFKVLGIDLDEERSPAIMALNIANEFLFPTEETKDDWVAMFQAALAAATERVPADPAALDVHSSHQIRLANGGTAPVERDLSNT